jgi:hypothetical protein
VGVLIVAIAVAAWIWTRKSSTPSAAPSIAASDSGGTIGDLIQAIGDFEKSGFSRNNPGNLRPSSPLPGQVGTSPAGFAIFDTPESGQSALQSLITRRDTQHPEWDFYDFFNYYLRGSTTAASVDAQGDSDAYAEFVASRLGVDPTTPVSQAIGG